MNKWRRGERHGTKRKNKISEQFVYYTREMIGSPAYRALSLQARKVLRRLELEHMAHGGQDNGKLPCRYHDFIKYGCRRNGLSAALIEVEALGFAKTMTLGTRAFGNVPGKASTFLLTYLPTADAPATNDWKKFPPSRKQGQRWYGHSDLTAIGLTPHRAHREDGNSDNVGKKTKRQPPQWGLIQPPKWGLVRPSPQYRNGGN
jgi:hypothetical protein